MKSTKKRMITFVLAVAMIFSSSAFSMQAFAAEDATMESTMTEQRDAFDSEKALAQRDSSEEKNEENSEAKMDNDAKEQNASKAVDRTDKSEENSGKETAKVDARSKDASEPEEEAGISTASLKFDIVVPDEKFEVTIEKINIAGEELVGAHLELRERNSDALIEKWVTDGTSHKVELYPGEYVLKEALAPTGYDLATDIYFNLDDSGEMKTISCIDPNYVDEQNRIITMVDEDTLVMNKDRFDVFIHKVDMNANDLIGATMSLRDSDGNEIESWVTDGREKAFSLRPGEYVLQEVAAPNGYDIAPDITFVVDAEGNVKLTKYHTKYSYIRENEISMIDEYVHRTKQFPVTFRKVDESGAELFDARLRLSRDDDYLGRITIDEWTHDGTSKFLMLEPGKYYFQEVSAPTGYEIAPEIAFTISEDGELLEDSCLAPSRIDKNTMTITMTDKLQKHKVLFSKTDIGGEELAGATIELQDKETGDVIEKWETDGKTKEFNLKPGEYVFHEVAAPDGFLVASDITFEVTLDGDIVTTDVTVSGDDNNLIVMVDDFKAEDTKTPENPKPDSEKPKDEKPGINEKSKQPSKKATTHSSSTADKASANKTATGKMAKHVKTGDATAYTVYLLLMAGAATAVFGLRRYRKEEK